MSNRTLIPTFQRRVGNWKYYICTMKYGEVARQVNFGYEMGGNTELSRLIQRGLTDRTKAITEYLLKSDHRFLGALVIAAWGGEPQYTPLIMEDPEGMLKGIDDAFGVLTFDGTQRYYALPDQAGATVLLGGESNVKHPEETAPRHLHRGRYSPGVGVRANGTGAGDQIVTTEPSNFVKVKADGSL
jgi:hypothetical protein